MGHEITYKHSTIVYVFADTCRKTSNLVTTVTNCPNIKIKIYPMIVLIVSRKQASACLDFVHPG